MAIMVIVGIVTDEVFGITDFTQVASFLPMGLLLPVLGVLSVTGEWGSARTSPRSRSSHAVAGSSPPSW